MTEASPQINETHAVSASPVLKAKIEALRRKHVSVATFTGVSLTVVVGVELLALAMFVDWWLDLPWAARLISLTAQLSVFAYLIIRYVAVPLLQQPDDDELALMMEKARPGFRTRLIASLQLARPGAIPPNASSSMAYALVQDTEAFAAPMDFQKIVPTERLKKLRILAVVIPVAALVVFTAGGQTSVDLLRRVFMANIPVPRKTRVFVADGDKLIGIGDSVRLEATAQGVIPATGLLKLNYRGRRDQEFTLEQNREDRSRFGRTIDNVQDSFGYRIYLNDGASETFRVRAVPRPTVATIQCEQEYPAYSGLKPGRRSLGDLSLLAGSKLKLHVTATKPLKMAALKLVGLDQHASLRVDEKQPTELFGEITIPTKDLTGFSVEMLDTDGMESRDSAVYRVEIIPDKVPLVRITSPTRKEELATRTARPFIGYQASDDFAIAQVSLRYKSEAIDHGAEKAVELDLGGETPAISKRQFQWNLGELQIAEGTMIEYWIAAQDNNDATGPGIGRSDHQFLRIVSPDEKLADIWNRAGDYMGSIDDLAQDEEKLNNHLGTIILERTGAGSLRTGSDRTIDK